jgi:hypothetical protein
MARLKGVIDIAISKQKSSLALAFSIVDRKIKTSLSSIVGRIENH